MPIDVKKGFQRLECSHRVILYSSGGFLEHDKFDASMKAMRNEIESRVLLPGVEDAFLNYLYALLSEGKVSKERLLASISLFRYNWEAWMVETRFSTNPYSLLGSAKTYRDSGRF